MWDFTSCKRGLFPYESLIHYLAPPKSAKKTTFKTHLMFPKTFTLRLAQKRRIPFLIFFVLKHTKYMSILCSHQHLSWSKTKVFFPSLAWNKTPWVLDQWVKPQRISVVLYALILSLKSERILVSCMILLCASIQYPVCCIRFSLLK